MLSRNRRRVRRATHRQIRLKQLARGVRQFPTPVQRKVRITNRIAHCFSYLFQGLRKPFKKRQPVTTAVTAAQIASPVVAHVRMRGFFGLLLYRVAVLIQAIRMRLGR